MSDTHPLDHGQTRVFDGFKHGWDWSMNHRPNYIPDDTLSRIKVRKGN